MGSTRHVIVGCGGAGLSAMEAIRALDRDCSIILISAEAVFPYSRVLLNHYVGGEIAESDVYLRPPAYFQEIGAELHLGQNVESVDARRQEITLRNGHTLPYDNLLIATGARPRLPPLDGLDQDNIVTLWTLYDAQRIIAAAQSARHALILGAGRIGLKAVQALTRLGVRCTVIELMEHVLPGIVDDAAAVLIEDRIRQSGVELITGRSVERIVPVDDRQKRVILTDGVEFLTDLVVMATGATPNIHYLEGSGVQTDRGIVVDHLLGTNVAGVFAAGDVAQTRDVVTGHNEIHGTWPLAVEQGSVVGKNMAGRKTEYRGSLRTNVIKVFGTFVASLGVTAHSDTGTTEVFHDAERGIYRKIFFENGRLAGALLVGEVDDAGIAQGLIRKGASLGIWNGSLRRGPLSYGQVWYSMGRGVGTPDRPVGKEGAS